MWQMGGEADGVEGVRLAVRQMIKAGADWIKATATGGRTGTSHINRASYRVDELQALVDEAHRFGRRVGTHCVNTAGIINSLEAGVDMIIHGSMNEADGAYKFRADVAERIARGGRSVNITNHVVRSKVWNLKTKIEAMKNRSASDKAALVTELDTLQRSLEDRYDFTIRYQKLGIPLLPGSDAGFNFFRFGQFYLELEGLVEAGVSPMKAIQAATRVAADAIGYSNTIGTVERGKEADLLVVDGNPAERILDLGKVRAVFLGGAKVK